MNVIEGFRLSSQQKHLWEVQQDSLAYGALCTIMLEGHLSVALLKAAVQSVIDRYEILRTAFRRVPGMTLPLQVPTASYTPIWRYLDLGQLASAQQTTIAEQLFQAEQRIAFDVAQNPLLRVTLLFLSIDRALLMVSLPALCADAWTLTNLMREISNAYKMSASGGMWSDEPLQYADFSEWQHELLESADAHAGIDYWRKHGCSELPIITLPYARKTAVEPGIFAPRALQSDIEADQLARIELIAQKCQSSVSTCLLACWQILLGRLMRDQRVVVGTVFDGRRFTELRDLVGLSAKSLPIHYVSDEHLRFSEVMERLDETISEANAQQDYFIWEQHGPSAANAADAYFPLGFEALEWPETRTAAGVQFSLDRRYNCIDRFHVKLSCVRVAAVLRLELHYDANLFHKQAIFCLMRQFRTLIASICENPDAPVAELELLSDTERQQLLFEWNATTADYSHDRCIHQLFESQAARTPDAVAVCCEREQISYQALNQCAEQLARYLRTLGVGPEVFVGICMERGIALVLGILAVLKAGGVFVPLDPAYPAERIAFMLEDAQVKVLITTSIYDLRLTIGDLGESDTPIVNRKSKIVNLDADWPTIARQSATPPPSTAAPGNLAYVIYTSGSTGAPKGVMISTGSVAHYAQALQASLQISADDHYLHTASFTFSSSVRQLLVPLAHGATVVIATAERVGNPLALFELIAARGVTISDLVPSYWRACVRVLALDAPQRADTQPVGADTQVCPYRLRLFLSASEPLPPDTPRDWRAEFGHAADLVNMFGQTETAGIVTTYRIPDQLDEYTHVVPIGRPLAGAQIYLLDRQLQPVPIGIVGEVYIGGAQLARGYLGRPDLTAENFVPNPFAALTPAAAAVPPLPRTGEGAGGEGTRLYKTGDLARYQPDGDIEFLGRSDDQIKLRGYRVEPGEIEAALVRHPLVTQAVVLANTDVSGDHRLVAYLVTTKDERRKTSEERDPSFVHHPSSFVPDLRAFLQERLPVYMVPAAFVPLAALPLTPNGKLDRRALAALSTLRPTLDTAYVAPRTKVEEAIADIWANALGLERVSVYDNFFKLGGHSLLATEVIYRLNELFLLDMSLQNLFESPTIASLSEVVQQRRSDQQDSANIARMLADIQQLSANELQQLLAHNEDRE